MTATAEAAEQKLIYYVPVHGNFSQVEHSAVFLHSKGAEGSRVFVYGGGFNTEHKKMRDFYENAPEWGGCGLRVADFSVSAVLAALREDESAGRRAVAVLTASTNYGFGRAQRVVFECARRLHPKALVDTFSVGHCMMGCESCGLSEHNVPLFFTRWKNAALPFSAAEIRDRYWGAGARVRVLVCPSVGDTSFLGRDDVLRCVEQLARELEPKGVVFAAKLHGFCHLDDAERPHALFTLSDADRRGAQFLHELLGARVADEKHYNVLPFLEAADVVLTDVNSSLPFEALMFPRLRIIAHEDAVTRGQDPTYVALLNTFESPADLRKLVLAAVDDAESSTVRPSGEEGVAFFRSKYGVVDGHEVERAAELRKWNELAVKAADAPASERTPEQDLEEFNRLFEESFPDPGPLEYLARGLVIPQDVADYMIFEGLHNQQLHARGIPQSLWKKLFKKITTETLDAGSVFSFARCEGKLVLVVSAEEGIDELEDIFLVDHAWSSTLQTSREQLETIEGLVDRVESLLQLEPAPQTESKKARIDRVWNSMWSANGTYTISGPEGQAVVWYINDEVGSRLMHSPEPNCRIVPFIYEKTGVAYSLLWPIERIDAGEVATRDFAEGVEDDLEREVKLLSYGDPTIETEPALPDALERRLIARQEVLAKAAAAIPPPPPEPHSEANVAPLLSKRPIVIRSDTPLLYDFLKRPEFKMLSAEEIDEETGLPEPDVLFLATTEWTDFDSLRGTERFVSQLPGERCVCFKNEIARTVQRVFGTASWMPDTFDLEVEMPEFVATFQQRAAAGLDNHWIAKPWNAGRGQGIVISDQLPVLLRQADAGPVAVSKYIERPATLGGRKFDLRFLVYARSKDGWERPEFSVYNTFWIRFANKEYALDDLWDYEKHMTVMNYRPGSSMTHMRHPEFIKAFEAEHHAEWSAIRKEIDRVMALLFQAATTPTTDGDHMITPSINGFAVYGIDVLLTHDLHPVIEECNFSPDCTRACNYDADFYNKTFGYFFLGETEHVTRIL